jgi:hypothetical protein
MLKGTEELTKTQREIRLIEAHEAAGLELERIRMLLEHQLGVEVRNNEFGDPYIEVNERSA